VGAGEQQYRKLCSHLNYTSQDFNGYDGKGNDVGLHTGKWDVSNTQIISDITKIPVPNSTFDVVLCTEVLEHVPDPVAAVREMVRLLKNGGKIILTVPFNSLTHFAPFHFYTGFNRYFFDKILAENGVVLEEVKCNGDAYSVIAQELRRNLLDMNQGVGLIKVFNRFILCTVLNRLMKLRSQDPSSGKLSCYGYFVVGKKFEAS
jgi:SAM-dependent methyltransferase